jgi:hypothetical protein
MTIRICPTCLKDFETDCHQKYCSHECWLAGPALKPPDLQELVKQHGGYTNIPPSAWNEYDAAVARYRAARLAGLPTGTIRNPSGRPGHKRLRAF